MLSFLFEHQNRAGDLAGFHRTEGVIDVLQLATLADHVVEVETALQVIIYVARHIDAETVAANHCALNLALGQEHRPVELNLMADRNHSDYGGGAAWLDALKTLLGQLGDAD